MPPRARTATRLSALGIAVFQVVGTFGASHNQPERRPVDALAIALVLAGPAALFVRDRYPRTALAVALVASTVYIGHGYPFGPIFVSVAAALFTAVQSGHRTATWALCAAGYVGFLVAEAVDPRGEGLTLEHMALVAGWLVVFLVIAELIRVRTEQIVQRRRSAEEEQQRRVADQRLRLAQELHDVLAHNISLVNVQASVALHLLDERPEQARPALTAIKEASHEALDELRVALDLLRQGDGAPLAPAPRLVDLDRLVDGVRAGGLDVQFHHDEPVPHLPGAVELAAYRIVQEALTNVTRHAHARSVTVAVRYDDGVQVEVVDDGIGGAAFAGRGIEGMRERTAALGGTFDAGPAAGGGFRVAAHLPVPS